ncbi:MAG: hypothetical protein OXK80_01575 [Bdellovibrionales bacterium]|nr:hypothetical protein [Bdellovibrionales bacterium]
MNLLYKFIGKILFICLFSFHAFAGDHCENSFTKPTVKQSHMDVAGENEFAGFRVQPSKITLSQLNWTNRLLRIREFRPDFDNKKAYEVWLIKRQQDGTLPANPYGYAIREVVTQGKGFSFLVRHKMESRRVPSWINSIELFNNNPEVQQQYEKWAEEYYEESQFYPPGYLKWIKDRALVGLILKQEVSLLHPGVRGRRSLEDVILAFESERHSRNDVFTSKLMTYVMSLHKNERWMDVGAGNGSLLEDGILVLHNSGRAIGEIPHTLSINYEPQFSDIKRITSIDSPKGVPSFIYPNRLPQSLSSKHEIWNDRLLQNIPNEEFIPKPKLITDIYGMFSYSTNPASVINKYMSILNEGGVIGIVYNDDTIVRLEDKELPVHEWVITIRGGQISIEHGKSLGVDIDSSLESEAEYNRNRYMWIRNVSGKSVELPDLVQVGFGNKDGRFRRVFRPSSDIRNAP